MLLSSGIDAVVSLEEWERKERKERTLKAKEIEWLYSHMTDRQLHLVRQAFSHDLEAVEKPKERAFARSRIKVIDKVLASRKAKR